jgi:hypothetical protein
MMDSRETKVYGNSSLTATDTEKKDFGVHTFFATLDIAVASMFC